MGLLKWVMAPISAQSKKYLDFTRIYACRDVEYLVLKIDKS